MCIGNSVIQTVQLFFPPTLMLIRPAVAEVTVVTVRLTTRKDHYPFPEFQFDYKIDNGKDISLCTSLSPLQVQVLFFTHQMTSNSPSLFSSKSRLVKADVAMLMMQWKWPYHHT